MKHTELEQQPPSRGSKHICVPFENEAQYQECVADVAQYRHYLTQLPVFSAMKRGFQE